MVEFEREVKPEEPMKLKILEKAIFEHILSEEEEENEDVFDQYALWQHSRNFLKFNIWTQFVSVTSVAFAQ